MKAVSKSIQVLLITYVLVLLHACSADVGGSEDNTAGTVTLTSLNDGAEIIGNFTITWNNDEPNRSFVDIEISIDSGETYLTVPIAARLPDTGSYVWDTNTVTDCRACRVRVTATDIKGNVTSPSESAMDFIINNVPQVLGTAFFYDVGNDGAGNLDTIVVPFDKEIEITTGVASEIFSIPVLGDSFGPVATVSRDGSDSSKLIISMNNVVPSANFHFHVGGNFNTTALIRTASSGINIRDDIGTGIVFSVDTGKTAAVSDKGIDISPTFSDSGLLLGGITSTRAVALGDMDGDGDLDLVTTRNTAPILFNGGLGANFSDSGAALGVSSTLDVALGDVNGDGFLDIVTGNLSFSFIYINSGDGVNYSSQSLPPSLTQAVALGDVDGDGDLDLVNGKSGPGNTVWLNGGDNSGSNTGVFTNSLQTLGANNTYGIALGDVDGDGDMDIVEGNKGEPNRVWTNGGVNTGVFTDSGQSLGIGETETIALEDVDGDGDLDIVTGNFNEANRVWLNGGDNTGTNTGQFTDSGQRLGLSATTSIVLDDIDEDGDLDMVVGNNGDANRVWFNNINNEVGKQGVFADTGQALVNSATTSGTNTSGVALGDIDGDGDLDMVTGNGFEEDRVWLNSFRSSASERVTNGQVLGASDTASIQYADVDGDGDLDIVTGNLGQANRILLNNINNNVGQAGVFADSGQVFDPSVNTNAVALGDVDGDGDLDIITGNSPGAFDTDNSNRVLLNNITNVVGQEGVFTDSGQTLGSSDTQAILLGDVDGDDDLDIVTGNSNFGPNLVWLNGGDNSGSNTGIFTDSTQTLGTSSTFAIALDDVDGDGDLDIVSINDAGLDNSGLPILPVQDNIVWLNGGDSSGSNTGVFMDSMQAAIGLGRTISVLLGDVDSDGDLDLVTGYNTDLGFVVRLNGGDNTGSNTGIFSAPVTYGNSTVQSIALDDIDGDGDMDILTGNTGDNLVWVNLGGDPVLFVDSGDLLGSLNTRSITLGDVDGDGDLDMATGNDGGNRIWLNDF